MSMKRKLPARRVDHTGKKYNNWTILQFVRNRPPPSGGAVWLCRCICGIEKEVEVKSILNGTSNSCGCTRGQYNGTMSLAREVWRLQYKDADLTFEEFYKLSQENCFYCEALPSNKRKHVNPHYCEPFIYNGLDRVDNNRGHSQDNVVPCCWECNEWKADYTKDYFFEKIAKIYQKFLLKNK